MTTVTPVTKGKIQLSHTVLPDGYNDMRQWGNSFAWQREKRKEFESWLNTLLYNNKKAYTS